MRCFRIRGMKNQHAAILESVGTTEEFIISFTRLPSTTYSVLLSYFFSLLFLKFLKSPFLFDLLNALTFSQSKFDLA